MKSSRVEALSAELARRIHAGWPQDGLVPGVREIAGTYHASPATVVATLGQLAEDGIIVRAQGRKRYAVPGSQPAVLPAQPGKREKKFIAVAAEIRCEILGGRLSAILPSVKELAARFCCGFRTIRAALDELATRGYLNSRGRGYVVTTRAAVPRSTQQSSLYLAGPARIAHSYPHALSFLQAVEKEIDALSWGKLEYLLSDSPLTIPVPPPEKVTGFIHFPSGHDWGEFFWGRCKSPVVLINLPERPGLSFPGRPCSFQISPDNRRAGREVALHLHARGYRSIAYLTHQDYSGHPWSKIRLDGLREIYPDCTEMRGLGNSKLLKKSIADDVSTLQKNLRNQCGLTRDLLADRLGPAYDLASQGAIAVSLRTCFEELIRRHGARAWVCANDTIAAIALGFLEKSGIKCPGEIALVGFDNSTLSYLCGLTSYDFETDKMGHLAVRYFANPRDVSGGLSSIQVSGRLQERRSS